MQAFQFIIVALLAVVGNAFRASMRSSLKMSFDLDKAVNTLSRNRILTKTGQLGLLSRLERSGFTLKTAIPLIVLADDLDLIGVLEASSEKVLPLVATAIETAPLLLPVAGIALKQSPITLFIGAALSAAAAAGAVLAIPDDSVVNIALQTALVVPLGAVLPGALGVGGVVLSKLK